MSLFLIMAAMLAAWMAGYALTSISLPASPLDFSIQPGSSLRSATRQIEESGIGISAWQFNLLARLTRNESYIKAGSYEVRAGVTPWQILRKITLGDFSLAGVVFIEGWTFRQIRAALQSNPSVRQDGESLSEADIMARIGSPGEHPEGWFFPDTYFFSKGESDLTVLARAHQTMRKRLQAAWQRRSPDLPISSPYEALILASIVEKETGRNEERAMIAGVFVNRLRIGMRLQTDPTVIYGLGKAFDGNLRKRDLETDQAFNTYTRDGLPPRPIAMPGQASLEAAMNPAKTDALYFVARGDGSSAFSNTLEDHVRAVAKFQLRR